MNFLKRISFIILASIITTGVYSQEGKYFQKPFKIQVDGKPLDIANGMDHSTYDWGHAGPYFSDLNGDNKKDLLLGGFSGRFRYYQNTGTGKSPAFSKFEFIRGGDTIAWVRIYCCIGSSPQLADIDGDNMPDLISGSYDPGECYWFKGLGKGQFAKRQTFLDETGASIVAHPEHKGERAYMSFGSTVTMVDWDADGDLDLLLGSFRGEIFLRKNIGTRTLPVYTAAQEELRINNEKAIPDDHAALELADWNGDGLWDILVGASSGEVYLLKNSGKKGAPQFTSREILIGPGEGYDQWVDIGNVPRRGIRAQINVTDFNGDGKPDILLGDFSSTITPRKGLSQEEMKKVISLRDEVQQLNNKATKAFKEIRAKKIKWDFYKASDNDPLIVKQARAYSDEKEKKREELSQYLESYYDPMFEKNSDTKAHGFVWVYLGK